ncbi:MAG TPA: hypothetical protein DDY43_05205 [Synechococcales bacterium UBA10510]|nr:hypothetical protein [Synechococcales bacterium UBA10510]
MKSTRHKPEQIIRKLRLAEQMLNEGHAVTNFCQAPGGFDAYLPLLATALRRNLDRDSWMP